jgi:hypothetical protein
MNKTLFEYCQRHLRTADSGKFKVTASFKQLVSLYNVGYIKNGWFFFNEQDKRHLIDRVAIELEGTHLFRDTYPALQTRTQIAAKQRNEKVGALKVSENFILLNSLDSLRLNQQVTKNSQLSSLGSYVCASEILTVEHQQIVLVENLIVMANLASLNIPESLHNALWLYRGDIKKQQQTSTAYQFFRRFQETNQLLCFSDFDPAGLKIALTCGAIQWLTLAHPSDINITLAGHEHEWFKQVNEKGYLTNTAQLTEPLSGLFATMNNNQKTLKQEHIIEHALELRLYPLPKDAKFSKP